MRPQNPKTPSPQFKSDNPAAESDASFSANSNKSVQKAIATHQSRGPPPPPNTRTDAVVGPTRGGGAAEEAGGCCGREKLKRHWVEVSGRVWIPDIWGQEDLLKDWIDCSAFDSSLVGGSIMSARESLVEEARRATSTRFGIENSC